VLMTISIEAGSRNSNATVGTVTLGRENCGSREETGTSLQATDVTGILPPLHQPETEMSEPSDTSPDIAPEQQKPRKKMGRPSKYTPELAAEICERLSDGEPLRQICRDEHMPAWTAVYAWAAADKELSERIAQARKQGYDAIAEDLLHIADTPLMGEEETSSNSGLTITRKDMLGHRKLQIETRLKLLAKWDPSKYGDRQIIAGDKDNPLTVTPESTFFADLLAKMEQTRREK